MSSCLWPGWRNLSRRRIIGSLAPTSYSFYGFQWQNTDFLKEAIETISKMMKLEGVEAVVMTPA